MDHRKQTALQKGIFLALKCVYRFENMVLYINLRHIERLI